MTLAFAFRSQPEFGQECRGALMGRMAAAVSDVRLLASLRADCQDDITQLCADGEPGKGKVLECLQVRVWGEGGTKAVRKYAVLSVQRLPG